MEAISEVATGRFYKSRKARPCDACRKRKVTCDMPSGPPCRRCGGKSLPCTFEHGPGDRKRPAPMHLSTAAQSRLDPVATSSSPPPPPLFPSQNTHLQPAMPPAWLDDPAFFSYQLGRTWGFQGSFGLASDVPVRAEMDGVEMGSDHLHLHVQERPADARQMQDEGLVFPHTATLELLDDHGEQRHHHEEPQPQSQLELELQSQPQRSPSYATSGTRSPSIGGASSVDESLAASNTISVPLTEPFTTNGSLEFLPGAFSFYIGPTGVSDIHLLSREPFGSDGVTEPSVKGLKYRRMQGRRDGPGPKTRRGRTDGDHSRSSEQDAGSPPAAIFGLTDHTLLDKAEPKPDAEAAESAWASLWKILTPHAAWSLIHLYARFVDPYFPILSCHQMPQDPHELSNMSLALLTAICATALPFVIHDRSLYALLLRPPSIEKLYRLCWQGISQELHAPSLSTLQACLLLQQRLPTNLYLNDTAFSWSLMATAVSVAQTIGLHRDPSSWSSVPMWERRLRRRLWWALWAMEKWVALARGMPSHLADDEADVELMRLDDTSDTLSNVETAQPHLYYLVSLTSILAEIQKTYYTVRATRQTCRNLAVSLEAGRATRVRLKAWHDSLPLALQSRNRQATLSISNILADTGGGGSREENCRSTGSDWQQLDGNASLHLSYIVTHMTLFRALLRPLEAEGYHDRNDINCNNDGRRTNNGNSNSCGGSTDPGTRAVMRGALLCVREFVEFVEVLTPTQWNAFWHGWSRANFAMAGSFMVHLLHVVSTQSSSSSAPSNTAATATEAVRITKNTATSRTETNMGVDNDADMSTVDADRDAGTNNNSGPTARPGFTGEYQELVGWIRRWRWASRVSANGAAGAKGLTNLGLLRVETFIGQLGGLDDV